MYKNLLKRVIDFLIAFSGLILLSPVFLIVLVVLYFQNDGKPFFFQRRPGLNEKMFNIIKFKTMTDKKDSKGNYLPDELHVFFSEIHHTKADTVVIKVSDQ